MRNYLTNRDKVSVQEINQKPSLTRQEFKRECDVGIIMERFHRTGMLGDPRKAKRIHEFMDCTSIKDYESAKQTVIDAQKAFDSLPNSVKRAFGYKITNMYKAAADPTLMDSIMRETIKDGVQQIKKAAKQENEPKGSEENKT